MKRYGNIYHKIYDIDNLRQAHKMARKGKSWYNDVKIINGNEQYYLLKLRNV
jgi:hypothetical protein